MTRSHDSKFDARYTDNWHNLSKAVKQSQMKGDRVQCACCQRLFSWENTETHHTSYLGEGDRAGVNLFALCGNTRSPGTCHHWVHLKEQWHRSKTDPVWGSGNHKNIVTQLQNNYAAQSRPMEQSDGRSMLWAVLAIVGAIGVFALFQGKPKFTPTQKTIVVSQRANIRAIPNGKILCVVERNEILRVLSTDGQWISVEACGRSGVIHRSLIKN